MSLDPLAVQSAGSLLARAAAVAPGAYSVFAHAIAATDAELARDFAWAAMNPENDQVVVIGALGADLHAVFHDSFCGPDADACIGPDFWIAAAGRLAARRRG